MNHRMPLRHGLQGPGSWIGCLAAFCLLLGCAGGSPGLEQRMLESPGHHVANGLKLMQKGRLEAARREFGIALRLDPRSAFAHRGEAMIRGSLRDFKGAFEEIHQAVRYTRPEDLKDPIQKAFSGWRSARWDRGRSWLSPKDREMPEPARSFVLEFLNAYYMMAVAFRTGAAHEEGGEALGSSLNLTDAFSMEAFKQLKRIRDLDGLTPGRDFARGLALVERVSRAEAAGLLVRTLDLPGMLKEKEPEAAESGRSSPGDLQDHPLERDVHLVLSLGIDGFTCAEDGSFHPEDPMTRDRFAAALADILGRNSKDGSVEEHETQLSPFEDVPLSSPHLHAVATCAALGLLEGEGGRFRPKEPLSGPVSVRSVLRLTQILESRASGALR